MLRIPDRRVLGPCCWLLLLLAAGCGPAAGDSLPAGPSPAAPAVPSVVCEYPKRATLHLEVGQPGVVESFEETLVFAMVDGYVKEGWKDIGAVLKKNDVLAELAAPDLVDRLKQKEALVEQARVAIDQAREAEKSAEAAYKSATGQVEVAEANRQILLARQKRAHSQYVRLERTGTGVLDRENVEEAQLGYETARAAVAEADAKIKAAQAQRDEARAKWGKATADVSAARAQLQVAERDRDIARDMVGYLSLRAPYNGVVTKRNVNTGDRVQAATTGKPLYVVQRRDTLRVVVQVPESDAFWVKPGKDGETGVEARVHIQALPGQTFTKPLARTSWSLDPGTHTLRAEIDLPNEQDKLQPGKYAFVILSADVKGLRTLPRSAVVTEGDVTRGYQTYCYQVEEDSKVHRLLIRTGAGNSERVEVLKKQVRSAKGSEPRWVDFTGDERIVATGVKGLTAGQEVTVAAPK